MTFDSEQQKQEFLRQIQNEKLKKEIEMAKIVEPWIPEYPDNNFVKQEN